MADRPTILMLTNMHESGMRRLREAGEVRMATALDPETLRREVVDADALIVRTAGVIDAPLMDCAPRLKVIGRHGVGYDHVDVPAATERGILVAPGDFYGPAGERFVRVALTATDERVQAAVARL